MTDCADCGQTVQRQRGDRWAVVTEVEGHLHYSFCCRSYIEGTVLMHADYHHIEGEQQRHYPE